MKDDQPCVDRMTSSQPTQIYCGGDSETPPINPILITGVGGNPLHLANNVLERALDEKIPVTPMKLERLIYFVTCVFMRTTHRRLLREGFQVWRYGPVCGAVYDEFQGFGGDPITCHYTDAKDRIITMDESTTAGLRSSIDRVWNSMKQISPVELSRLAITTGSAWDKANQRDDLFINETDMAEDHTFDHVLTKW